SPLHLDFRQLPLSAQCFSLQRLELADSAQQPGSFWIGEIDLIPRDDVSLRLHLCSDDRRETGRESLKQRGASHVKLFNDAVALGHGLFDAAGWLSVDTDDAAVEELFEVNRFFLLGHFDSPFFFPMPDPGMRSTTFSRSQSSHSFVPVSLAVVDSFTSIPIDLIFVKVMSIAAPSSRTWRRRPIARNHFVPMCSRCNTVS